MDMSSFPLLKLVCLAQKDDAPPDPLAEEDAPVFWEVGQLPAARYFYLRTIRQARTLLEIGSTPGNRIPAL